MPRTDTKTTATPPFGDKTDVEKILERLDRLEAKITPVAESTIAIAELKEELSPRINEAVQALIIELADVEADFQIEKLLHLIKKAMRHMDNFSITLDMLNMFIDFVINVEPLLKTSVPKVVEYLDDLDQKNVFKMMVAGLDVLKSFTAHYSPEDIDRIVNQLSRIKTAPQASPISLVKALGDPQIRQGIGVALELTRVLGAARSAPH
ncbi:MAG: hypothetical protein CSA29_03035 [Desulfobacterales bacterium]|nr:MAG: hypothetical protein CSA29_03035 [Desulfobacterales bacterium]